MNARQAREASRDADGHAASSDAAMAVRSDEAIIAPTFVPPVPDVFANGLL